MNDSTDFLDTPYQDSRELADARDALSLANGQVECLQQALAEARTALTVIASAPRPMDVYQAYDMLIVAQRVARQVVGAAPVPEPDGVESPADHEHSSEIQVDHS